MISRRTGTIGLLLALAIVPVAVGGCTKVVGTPMTPAGAAANTVAASGTGTAQAAPDTAEMNFGVTTTSDNAKKALEDASKAAEKIAAALKKAGVDQKDIQTRDVSVYPETNNRDGRDVVTGYRASLSVQAKVRDIGTLGDVINAANGAGANSINGPTFTVADPAPTRAQAIDKAVADARKSAEAMAKAGGKTVGAVLSMSSSDAAQPPTPYYDSFSARSSKSVPIEPGQLDVTANVTVVFELK